MSLSATTNSPEAWQAIRQQRSQDLNQLSSALQNGDLASAQSAFSNFLNLVPGYQPTTDATAVSDTTASSLSVAGTSSVAADFSALEQALQTGNLTDAQSAYNQFQTDMQAKAGGHHHHHPHHGTAAPAASDGTSTNSSGSSLNLSA